MYCMSPGCCVSIIKMKYNLSDDNVLMKPFPVLQELSRSSAFCQSPLSCPDTKTGLGIIRLRLEG